jgi:hypothetical protein
VPFEVPGSGERPTPQTDALIERYRTPGSAVPSEWEIGDALNELGPGRVLECAVHFRQSCRCTNAKGQRYSFDRLETIAKIAAAFSPRERDPDVSFSHYEDFMRRRVLHALVPFCCEAAKRLRFDHKKFRDVLDDMDSATKLGADGSLIVEAMPRWGTSRLEISAPGEDVQGGLF